MANNLDMNRGSASGYFLSKIAADLLKSLEDLRSDPYDDQNGNHITSWVPGATIGYGHLITQNEWEHYKNGIQPKDAEALLKHDLAPSISAVQNTITAKVTQNEFDAMVIFAFNIGAAAFATSSVAKLINNPHAPSSYASLEAAWKAWDRSQGKVMTGLEKRRDREWEIYKNGIYK